jgi:hypothetical protein
MPLTLYLLQSIFFAMDRLGIYTGLKKKFAAGTLTGWRARMAVGVACLESTNIGSVRVPIIGDVCDGQFYVALLT